MFRSIHLVRLTAIVLALVLAASALSGAGSISVAAASKLAYSLFLPAIHHNSAPQQTPTNTPAPSPANASMPLAPPAYGSTVESWWATHPFNPESANPIPIGGISSPSNVINISPAANLQQVLKNAPNGSTIHFAPGNYSLGNSSTGQYSFWAKSSIHLIADQAGTVIIDFSQTTWNWFGCSGAQLGMTESDTTDNNTYYTTIAANLKSRTTGGLACINNRPGNIYFKNLTFDGGGTQNRAANFFYAYSGVVFDNVTFQRQYNLRVTNSSAFHDGQINDSAWNDNIWVRGSTFKGEASVVTYFDGCHGCGYVWNTIYMSFQYGTAGGGGFGHWNNNDTSFDRNGNGLVDDETSERRKSQYIVAYGNTWVAGTVNEQNSQSEAIFVNGSHALVARNKITAPIFFVARWMAEADNHNPGVIETFRDYVVRENLSTSNVTAFWRPDSTCYNANLVPGNTCDISGDYPAGSGTNILGYKVTGNVVLGSLQSWVWNNCPNLADFCSTAWPNGTFANNCQGAACALPPAPVPYPALSTTTPTPTPSPTAAPTSSPTPAPTVAPAGSYFPLGVYEHARGASWCINNSSDLTSCPDIARQYTASQLGLYDADLTPMLDNIAAHNLDTIMFAYNDTPRDDDWWTTTDSRGTNVYFGAKLYDSWFNNPSVTVDITTADQLFQPIANATVKHPSIHGYMLVDEPNGDSTSVLKLQLMTQAVHNLAAGKQASAVLIGLDRANAHLKQDNLDIATLDLYPYGVNNGKCDTHMSGFGLPTWDVVEYLRYILRDKPDNTPLWTLLQGHRWTSGDQFALRNPSPAEMRLQHWLAIGEGSHGILWFFYSPFITPDPTLIMPGLNAPENKSIYDEVAALASRVAPLRSTLLSLHKTIVSKTSTSPYINYDEKFTASVDGGGNVYASTLTNGSSYFVVVVNRNCDTETNSKQIRVNSTLTGSLKDLETGQVYVLGSPISFRAGDGKIFQLVP